MKEGWKALARATSKTKHLMREQFTTRLRRVLGQELARFLGEIEQDRVAVEHIASPSTIAGTLAFGLIVRYSGLC